MNEAGARAREAARMVKAIRSNEAARQATNRGVQAVLTGPAKCVYTG